MPRRRFGPEVEIHVRVERRLLSCRRSARVPLDEPLPDEEVPVELPSIEPTVEAADPTEEATVGADGVEPPLPPATGTGTVGAGTLGLTGTVTFGTGAGTVGTATETVGTGTGTVSARACPATRPAPKKTAVAATARIPG